MTTAVGTVAGALLRYDSSGTASVFGTYGGINNMALLMLVNARRSAASFGLSAWLCMVMAANGQSTWDGGGADDNWGTAANWSNNTVPDFPDELVFAGNARLTPNNNLNDVSVKNLQFNAGSNGFALNGNPFTIGDETTADYRSGGIVQLNTPASTINNNLTFSRGEHVVVSATGAGALNLNGTISREAGSGVKFGPQGGPIKTTLTNTSGLLGGWATIQNPSPAIPQETFLFAKVDASGNVVPYLDYTDVENIDGFAVVPETTFPTGMNASSNIRWFGSATAGSELTVAAPGVSNLNTFLFEQDALQVVNIGDGNTLRFTSGGGIFRAAATGAQNTESLRFTAGTVTAGNTNAPAELNVWTSTTVNTDPGTADPGEQHNFTIHFNTTNITDNPEGGKVTVVKNGPGAVRTSAAGHTFSGGLYLNRGVWRAQTNMSVAFGAGDVHVASGAQAYVNADGDVPNDFYLSGTGINEGAFHVGAIRIAADGAVMNGDLILTSDARIGNRGAQATNAQLGDAANQGVVLNGKITGNFDLEMSILNDQGAAVGGDLDGDMPTFILTNPANDWGGNTTIGNGRIRIGGLSVAGEVIPHGPGKGNVTLRGEGSALGRPTILTLDSHTETINGLSSEGVHTEVFVTNSTAGSATLRVGGNDATSTFGGSIVDHVGTVALTKIGAGTLTLTGANAYGGDTRIEGGTLSVNGAIFSDAADVYLNTGGTLALNFSGLDTIDSLFFNGAGQAIGTWGSMTSTATNKSSFFTGSGILQITTVGMGAIPGDFNADGKVDAADLNDPTTGWKARFGVDLQGADYLTWQRNLGAGASAGAAERAPEPASIVLLAALVICRAGGIARRGR